MVAIPIAPARFNTAQRSAAEARCDLTLSGTSAGAGMLTYTATLP